MSEVKSSDVLLLRISTLVNEDYQEYIPKRLKASMNVDYGCYDKPQILCSVSVEDGDSDTVLCTIQAQYRVPRMWKKNDRNYISSLREIVADRLEDYIYLIMEQVGHIAIE